MMLLADGPQLVYAIGSLVVVVVFVVVLVLTWRRSYRGGRESADRLGAELKGKAPYPISRNCPKCGSSDYDKATDQDDQFVLYVDRICSKCGTRYTPPAPPILSIMLIAFGVAMIGFTVFVTWYTRTNNLFDDLGGSFVALTPILILGAIIFGIYLVALGIAKLRQLKHLNQ